MALEWLRDLRPLVREEDQQFLQTTIRASRDAPATFLWLSGATSELIESIRRQADLEADVAGGEWSGPFMYDPFARERRLHKAVGATALGAVGATVPYLGPIVQTSTAILGPLVAYRTFSSRANERPLADKGFESNLGAASTKGLVILLLARADLGGAEAEHVLNILLGCLPRQRNVLVLATTAEQPAIGSSSASPIGARLEQLRAEFGNHRYIAPLDVDEIVNLAAVSRDLAKSLFHICGPEQTLLRPALSSLRVWPKSERNSQTDRTPENDVLKHLSRTFSDRLRQSLQEPESVQRAIEYLVLVAIQGTRFDPQSTTIVSFDLGIFDQKQIRKDLERGDILSSDSELQLDPSWQGLTRSPLEPSLRSVVLELLSTARKEQIARRLFLANQRGSSHATTSAHTAWLARIARLGGLVTAATDLDEEAELYARREAGEIMLNAKTRSLEEMISRGVEPSTDDIRGFWKFGRSVHGQVSMESMRNAARVVAEWGERHDSSFLARGLMYVASCAREESELDSSLSDLARARAVAERDGLSDIIEPLLETQLTLLGRLGSRGDADKFAKKLLEAGYQGDVRSRALATHASALLDLGGQIDHEEIRALFWEAIEQAETKSSRIEALFDYSSYDLYVNPLEAKGLGSQILAEARDAGDLFGMAQGEGVVLLAELHLGQLDSHGLNRFESLFRVAQVVDPAGASILLHSLTGHLKSGRPQHDLVAALVDRLS